MGILWAVKIQLATPNRVRPKVFGIESELNIAKRDDDRPRCLGHGGMTKQLPRWVIRGRELLRLAKRLAVDSEYANQNVDEFGQHRVAAHKLPKKWTQFN